MDLVMEIRRNLAQMMLRVCLWLYKCLGSQWLTLDQLACDQTQCVYSLGKLLTSPNVIMLTFLSQKFFFSSNEILEHSRSDFTKINFFQKKKFFSKKFFFEFLFLVPSETGISYRLYLFHNPNILLRTCKNNQINYSYR